MKYVYNENEGSHRFGFNGVYGGLYPWITGGTDYTFSRTFRDNTRNLKWNEWTGNMGFRLPLNFTKGKLYRNLDLSGQLYGVNLRYDSQSKPVLSDRWVSYIQQQIIQLLLQSGCRLAEPGEFTMRAFLNGRMDLSQAEAVADLIASQSKSAHNIALKQLRGGFSTELKELREKLIHFASLVELELDFAEEDVQFADRGELLQLVVEVLRYIQRLAKSFELGNAIKNGVPVAIVGAPNTGKSTLLNQLLGEERAIVSNIAGTTRDVIEEVLNIEGIQFRLIDTAGIREGAEEIEAMGIQRSKEKIVLAHIVLCLADLSQEESMQEVLAWTRELTEMYPDKKVLLVANKVDISQKTPEICEIPTVFTSAKEGIGMEDLKQQLVELVQGDFNLSNETIVSNVRHYDALTKTAAALEKAKYDLENNITADWVAMDIRQAMYDLGTITGDISTDDLLGNIFSKFCIGK
jgi:tRNA modification GTPase